MVTPRDTRFWEGESWWGEKLLSLRPIYPVMDVARSRICMCSPLQLHKKGKQGEEKMDFIRYCEYTQQLLRLNGWGCACTKCAVSRYIFHFLVKRDKWLVFVFLFCFVLRCVPVYSHLKFREVRRVWIEEKSNWQVCVSVVCLLFIHQHFYTFYLCFVLWP